MLSDVFGPDLFVVLFILVVGLVVPVWAIVDAASRPSGAFSAAGSSKTMWIVLIVVGWLVTGLIGIVLALVYLVSIRPRVRAVAP
jgi:Na+-driven multidrug efflux pump